MVVAGVDLGGTAVNYTFVDGDERWLIEGLFEHPARAKEGPGICLQQIADGLALAADKAGLTLADVAVVGLDTPGPASSAGVLSARGSTNFVHPAWAGFDIRAELAHKLGKPVTYLNDGNAGALWGHFAIFGSSGTATSISAIIGTGLGGGAIETDAAFQRWFVDEIRAGMPDQREEQADIPIHIMPHGDSAGARGAAIDALRLAREGGLI
jgi:predicted NBD/HSP70 family sugar kinase